MRHLSRWMNAPIATARRSDMRVRPMCRRLLVIAGLLYAAATAAAPEHFELTDNAEGPSCAYFTGLGNLNWTRPGGDWIDAKGQLSGDSVYAIESVGAGRDRVPLKWDVTNLVRGWIDGLYPNDGVFMRAEPDRAAGVADFHSRESPDAQARPVLELRWTDGGQQLLEPVADSFLDCSSLRSLGQREDLKVSRQQSAWLRFKVPRGALGLERATLRLTSDKRYGKGVRIGVFRAAPPHARALPPATQGIAASFPGDKGIAEHPSVLFATDFEAATWSREWSELSPRSTSETVHDDGARKFEPLAGRALRVRVEKGQRLGLNLRYQFARQGVAEPEEVYFRYYLRFGDDWNPTVSGGKLPGIAGTYGRAGWGLRKSDGYNGWSVRGAFARQPKQPGWDKAIGAIGSYAYHAEMRDRNGDYWNWNEGPTGLLAHNRWYAVEQRVRLNAPGARDGVFEAWIDGQRVALQTDVVYRHTAELKIEEVWMDVYHGGTEVADQDMTLYIDNVVIARRYIGPMQR